MPVEMTFRKLSQGKGIVNYFWKAKPQPPPQHAKAGRVGSPGSGLA